MSRFGQLPTAPPNIHHCPRLINVVIDGISRYNGTTTAPFVRPLRPTVATRDQFRIRACVFLHGGMVPRYGPSEAKCGGRSSNSANQIHGVPWNEVHASHLVTSITRSGCSIVADIFPASNPGSQMVVSPVQVPVVTPHPVPTLRHVLVPRSRD